MQPAPSTLSTPTDILKTMQPHSTQNMYVSTGNNSSGNGRTNPQAGGIFRGPPPATNAPRGSTGGARHVHMPAMYQQPMHQNMVLPTYTQFPPRTPTFPAPHIQYAPAPIPAYYQYQYLQPLQQQPAHSRSGVTVNASNTMPVQTGPNGQLAGPGTSSSQLQMLTGAVQPGSNAVIGVGASGSGQVGVQPMVGVIPSVAPQPVQQTSRRRHPRRLQIIDPTTKKNILDDLDKSNTNSESEYQEQIATTITLSEPLHSQADIVVTSFNAEPLPAQRLDNLGPTPIVSARADAPSVEILPTPQKTKSKKIPIIAPKEETDTDVQNQLTSDIPVVDSHVANITLSNNIEQLESNSAPQTLSSQSVELEPSSSKNALRDDSKKSTLHITGEFADTIPAQQLGGIGENEKASVAVAALPDASSTEQLSLDSRNVLGDCQDTMHTTEKINPIAPIETASEVSFDSTEKISHQLDVDRSDKSNEQVDITVAASAIENYPDEPDLVDLKNQCQPKLYPEFSEFVMTSIKENVTDLLPPSISNIEAPAPSSVDAPQTTEMEVEAKVTLIDPTELAVDPPTVLQSLINYNEGQWSPNNPTGKKQYDRQQLMLLREAKASRIQPEVKNVSILPQPNFMPSFVRQNNKRVQSMVGMIGGSNRNSEASGNYGGKQVSMPGVQGKSSMKGMIHVNLSLNQDVELNKTENAWRPRVLNKGEGGGESAAPSITTQEKEDLVRRVRGILNKLTPEKFDTLVEEIIKLKIDTPEKMDEVIVLVFEKAIDEPNFSVSYARLCHRLINEVKARDERMESGTKSNLAHFRNALLDKTEREFTQNVSQSTAKEKKLQPMVDKIRNCIDPNEKAELEALLEEEERKIRRRSGGTVRFIGELFKISMLTGKIIYSCIDTLLNPHSEDMLECLCKLLTTVGAKFEQTPVNTKEPGRCYSLEKSISKMQAIASKTDKDGAKVSSRVRFMLQDVIDLRKNKWQSTRNEAPKMMGQIEKEAKNEQLSAQYMNYNSSLSPTVSNVPQVSSTSKRDERDRGSRYGGDGRSGYGGSHSQRGDTGSLRHQAQGSGSGSGNNNIHSNGNNDDSTWHVQTGKGSRSQAVDSIKLEGLLNQNLDTKKMGGLSQFLWNNNAARQSATPTTTPSNSFAVLSSLIDKNSTDRDRDRDRSGPRNKGSYNKGSMERDRYNDRGIHSRTGSSQGSRENSTSRGGQQSRSLMNTSLQKSASHSKYTQPGPTSRLPGKGSLSSQTSSVVSGIYRSDLQSGSQQSTVQNNGKVGPPPAVFEQPNESDLKLIKSVISEMIELAAASKSVTPLVVGCIKRIPEQQRCGFLFYILTDYLHLANVGKQYRRYLALTVAQLIQQNFISVDHFKLAYKEFSELANDLIVDIPELWLYVLQFTGPLVVKKILSMEDLWNQQLKESSPSKTSKKFLKTYLTYCTREVGPNFTRTMWKKFNLSWSSFLPDNEIADFIEANNLEYVENELKAPVIDICEPHEKHVKNVIEHIEHLLKEGSTADCIIDYSNGNILSADKMFIRGLTETLSNFAIVYKDNSYKLEIELFQKFCIPVFQRYIDSHEEHQLECLYAMQLLVHGLEHPRGLLSELIGELYDGYVIQKESLCKWRDSKDQSAGKGVAVKSLNPFFNSIFNDENI